MADILDPLAGSIAAYRANHTTYTTRNAHRGQTPIDQFVTQLMPRSCVLDAGCGPGRDLARLTRWGHRAMGVDLCPEFVTAANQWAPCLLADLRALPFPDATFDAVWACASLVHLDDAQTVVALAELARVTRRGGLVCASVKDDTHPSGWYTDAIGLRWFKTWTVDRLGVAAKEAGFAAARIEADPPWVTLWAEAGCG